MTRSRLLFALPLLACLWSAGAIAARAETVSEKPDEALSPPPFSLRNLPDDSPELLKKKAALRLLASYLQTEQKLTVCMGTHPKANNTRKSFSQRNGNSLGLAMKVIKQSGGLTSEMSAALGAEVASHPAVDCSSMIEWVNAGDRDIYKAPQHLEDYRLIQEK